LEILLLRTEKEKEEERNKRIQKSFTFEVKSVGD
jgi:hypothetical protein